MSYHKFYGVITGVKDKVIEVDTNFGLVFIDKQGYLGKRKSGIVVGAHVKFYHRPQDRRPFVYKLTGE